VKGDPSPGVGIPHPQVSPGEGGIILSQSPPGERGFSSPTIPLGEGGLRGIEFQSENIPLSPPSEEGGFSFPKIPLGEGEFVVFQNPPWRRGRQGD